MQQELYPLSFDVPEKEDWLQAVSRELKGKSYDEYLRWNSLDGFEIEAYQDRDSSRAMPTPSARRWKIMSPIMSTDAQLANKEALHALNNGAEAIWFHKSFQGAAAEVATNGIDTSIAPVFIRHQSLHDPYRPTFRSGDSPSFESGPTWINGRRLRDRGANAVQELALVLAMCEDAASNGCKHLVVSLGMGSGLLTESAKLKAFHRLWDGWMNQSGLEIKTEVIAENLRSIQCQNDEYNNILRSTAAAMAATYGGCDYLLLRGWRDTADSSFQQAEHTTRLIGALLKEESHMDKCLNPVDGSYFLDQLTRTIATEAWSVAAEFSKKGIVPSIVDGSVKDLLSKQAAALVEAHLKKERTLCGVSAFQPAKVQSRTTRSSESCQHLPSFLDLEAELLNAKTNQSA